MQFAHLADTHIGARRYGFEGINSDMRYMLEETLDLVAREHIRVLVIAGDVFDVPRPRNADVEWAVRYFRGACERGVRVLVVPGEHDTPGRVDRTLLDVLTVSLDCFHNLVHRLDPRSPSSTTVEIGGVLYAGLPFLRAFREKRAQLTRELARRLAVLAQERKLRAAVLVGHMGLEGYTRPEDALLTPQDLPLGAFNYIALGHVHMRSISRRGDGSVLAYPGSLVPLSVSEIRQEKRGPLLVDLSAGEPSVEEPVIPLPRRYGVVRADLERLAEEIRRKAAELKQGSREPPLISVYVTVKGFHSSAGRRDLSRLLSKLEQDLGVYLRLAELRQELPEPHLDTPSIAEARSPLDLELEVLAGLLGGDRGLAELVRELKVALVEERVEDALDLVEKITGPGYESVWSKLLAGAQSRRRATHRSARTRAPRMRGGGLDMFLQ